MTVILSLFWVKHRRAKRTLHILIMGLPRFSEQAFHYPVSGCVSILTGSEVSFNICWSGFKIGFHVVRILELKSLYSFSNAVYRTLAAVNFPIQFTKGARGKSLQP